MTLPRLGELLSYWKVCAPTHVSTAKLVSAFTKPAGKSRTASDDDEYEPPDLAGTNDLTHMIAPTSPFGDAFEPKKMRVVTIDRTKKPEPEA
ncbi:MAG: hypothetical protein ACRDQZ_18950 [Mycobacteriales bacterium]